MLSRRTLLLRGKITLIFWYDKDEFPPYWRTGVSNNGWTTNEIAMDWIRHLEEYTFRRKLGGHRLLILDGHESHYSDEFEEYCKEHDIITLCMPPHSSHIL
jgi:hypothetical protein